MCQLAKELSNEIPHLPKFVIRLWVAFFPVGFSPSRRFCAQKTKGEHGDNRWLISSNRPSTWRVVMKIGDAHDWIAAKLKCSFSVDGAMLGGGRCCFCWCRVFAVPFTRLLIETCTTLSFCHFFAHNIRLQTVLQRTSLRLNC